MKTAPKEAEKAEISVLYSKNILRVLGINRFHDDKSGFSKYPPPISHRERDQITLLLDAFQLDVPAPGPQYRVCCLLVLMAL